MGLITPPAPSINKNSSLSFDFLIFFKQKSLISLKLNSFSSLLAAISGDNGNFNLKGDILSIFSLLFSNFKISKISRVSLLSESKPLITGLIIFAF